MYTRLPNFIHTSPFFRLRGDSFRAAFSARSEEVAEAPLQLFNMRNKP
jgi:hypothetical protein